MCDYSLMHLKSRAANVGDKLVTAGFINTSSKAFVSPADADTAVCVLPGTEIAFAEDVKVRETWKPSLSWDERIAARTIPYQVARFRQINLENNYRHHDALEFPDGAIVLLHDLEEGQHATVLQLPAQPKTEVEAQEQKRLEVVA